MDALFFHRELKSRKSGNPDESKFNVQDYVREQSQRGSCPPCNTWTWKVGSCKMHWKCW